MRCRLGVRERTVDKAQSLIDSPEHPQRDGILNFCMGAQIRAEPVGEIAMLCSVIELDGLVKMLMGAGKVAEIPTGLAGNAVREQGLGAIRAGGGFAQEKLRHFAQRGGLAAPIDLAA